MTKNNDHSTVRQINPPEAGLMPEIEDAQPFARWKVVHVPGGEPLMERSADGPWVLWTAVAPALAEAHDVIAHGMPAPSDYLRGYDDALHHAAFYVHDHCQHGEEHADVIRQLKRSQSVGTKPGEPA
jgi:hypothetical protein